jgi:small-conductance mechanosensitive channel
MIHLLVTAPADGWAFVRAHGDLLLVRPPYRRPTPVGEHVVARALEQPGFQAEERDFADWGTLITYLKERLVAVREAQGKAGADREEVFSLLRHAPPSILKGYLDRIEAELLPNQEWQPAQELLTRLLRVEKVRRDPQLQGRALDLLEQCHRAEAAVQSQRKALSDPSEARRSLFSRAIQLYPLPDLQDYARQIQQQHLVFTP